MTQQRDERFNTHAPPSPADAAVPAEEGVDRAQVEDQLETGREEVPNATDPRSPVDPRPEADDEAVLDPEDLTGGTQA